MKIKAEIYVNQDKSLSDLQTLIKHSFLLYFPRELLMSFSPSRRREAPCEGINPPGYLHPGKRKH